MGWLDVLDVFQEVRGETRKAFNKQFGPLIREDERYRAEQAENYNRLYERIDNSKKIQQESVSVEGVEDFEKESGYLQKVTEKDNFQKLMSDETPEIFTEDDFQDVLSEDDFRDFFDKQPIQNQQISTGIFDKLPEIKLEEL